MMNKKIFLIILISIFMTLGIMQLEKAWGQSCPYQKNCNANCCSKEEVKECKKEQNVSIEDLHKQGVTGKGVKVAVIDLPLLLEHEEYGSKIKKYTEVGRNGENWVLSAQGSVIASLLAGNKCGAAPCADLYYWAIPIWKGDFSYYSKALEQILEYNKNNPKEKITIVSISKALRPQPGFVNFDMLEKTMEKTKKSGLIIVNTCCGFLGSQCPLRGKWNDPKKRDVCYYAQNADDKNDNASNDKTSSILINKTTFAGFTGAGNCVFGCDGDPSWSVPYLAGVVALGFQVDPNLKEDDLYKYLRETGTPFKRSVYDEKTKTTEEFNVGWTINPNGFVDRVKTELEKSHKKQNK